jgi:hypothetical protein
MMYATTEKCLDLDAIEMVRSGRADAWMLPHVAACDACAHQVARPPDARRARATENLEIALECLLGTLPPPLSEAFPDGHEWAPAIRAVVASAGLDFKRRFKPGILPEPWDMETLAHAISRPDKRVALDTAHKLSSIRAALPRRSITGRFISALAGIGPPPFVTDEPRRLVAGVHAISARWRNRAAEPCPVHDPEIERIWHSPDASLDEAVREWLGASPAEWLESVALGRA